MPFDPSLPVNGSEIIAAELRGQFSGLNDKIDAGVLHLTFDLPQGADGGTDATGAAGATGPQGPPFASAVVDGVTTLSPGQPATVGVSFDGSFVRFIFGIPRGDTGAVGNDGGDGVTGPQGPPGEVTNAALDAAIAGTSSNSNGVATLGGTASPTYDAGQSQAMMDKIDELIAALRR